jgi:hypothetical protein
MDLKVSDVSRQRVRTVEDVSTEATASELVEALIQDLNLPKTNPNGQSLTYRALHRREARHLRPTERLGENVRSGDMLVLQPNVDAG